MSINENKAVYGSFNTVEVSKDKLLDILKENKDKHNLIYQYSVSGYYDKVDEWKNRTAKYAKVHANKFEEAAKAAREFANILLSYSQTFKQRS